jgi:hypothetical protein
MSRNETPYTETEALLAVLNDDSDRLAELLDEMLPNELAALRDQAGKLSLAASTSLYRRQTTPEEGP